MTAQIKVLRDFLSSANMFRLFIDEVGHHDMKHSEDPDQRYLGLTGVIMRLSYADGEFTDRLNEIKRQTFGRSDFALHRREILDAAPPPFDVLADNQTRAAFDAAVFNLVESSRYHVVTVVIDKKEHIAKYMVWQFQPYHYCMTVLLERYTLWLKGAKEIGDVMAESRKKRQQATFECLSICP